MAIAKFEVMVVIDKWKLNSEYHYFFSRQKRLFANLRFIAPIVPLYILNWYMALRKKTEYQKEAKIFIRYIFALRKHNRTVAKINYAIRKFNLKEIIQDPTALSSEKFAYYKKVKNLLGNYSKYREEVKKKLEEITVLVRDYHIILEQYKLSNKIKSYFSNERILKNNDRKVVFEDIEEFKKLINVFPIHYYSFPFFDDFDSYFQEINYNFCDQNLSHPVFNHHPDFTFTNIERLAALYNSPLSIFTNESEESLLRSLIARAMWLKHRGLADQTLIVCDTNNMNRRTNSLLFNLGIKKIRFGKLKERYFWTKENISIYLEEYFHKRLIKDPCELQKFLFFYSTFWPCDDRQVVNYGKSQVFSNRCSRQKEQVIYKNAIDSCIANYFDLTNQKYQYIAEPVNHFIFENDHELYSRISLKKRLNLSGKPNAVIFPYKKIRLSVYYKICETFPTQFIDHESLVKKFMALIETKKFDDFKDFLAESLYQYSFDEKKLKGYWKSAREKLYNYERRTLFYEIFRDIYNYIRSKRISMKNIKFKYLLINNFETFTFSDLKLLHDLVQRKEIKVFITLNEKIDTFNIYHRWVRIISPDYVIHYNNGIRKFYESNEVANISIGTVNYDDNQSEILQETINHIHNIRPDARISVIAKSIVNIDFSPFYQEGKIFRSKIHRELELTFYNLDEFIFKPTDYIIIYDGDGNTYPSKKFFDPLLSQLKDSLLSAENHFFRCLISLVSKKSYILISKKQPSLIAKELLLENATNKGSWEKDYLPNKSRLLM